MILYGATISSNTRRVLMFCNEADIPCSYKEINLLEGEQHKPEFLALNPNGKVPVIVDDDGFVLNESHTIMRYLADKHARGDWYPRDLRARATVDSWLDWVHTRLGLETGKVFLHTLVLGERRDPAKVAEGKGWLEKILPVMNSALDKRRYLAGERATLADLAAVTSAADLEQASYDFGPYPAIRRWLTALQALPSFVRNPWQAAAA